MSGHSSSTHPPLETAPGQRDNWVEASGGLPPYIKRVAKHIRSDSGMSTSRAIASAISQMKRWAAGGGDVTPQTRAQAARAVAQWEALKARNRSRSGAMSLAVPSGEPVPSPQTAIPGSVPVTSSTDGPRSTVATAGQPVATVPRGHADLRRAVANAGPDAPEDVRRRLVRRARQINALPLIPASWLNLSVAMANRGHGVANAGQPVANAGQGVANGVLDMAARNGRHIPGTSYNWRHGYLPLNARTALANRKGYWVTPQGRKVSAAQTRARLGVKNNAAAVRKLRRDPKALEGGQGGQGGQASAPLAKSPVRVRPRRGQGAPAPTPSPTQRQTMRANTAPSTGQPVDRGQAARTAAGQRVANARPAAGQRPVSPDMGRQTLARGTPAPTAPSGRSGPELVPAEGSPRYRTQRMPDGRHRVLDTGTGRTTGPMSPAEAKTKMDADNAAGGRTPAQARAARQARTAAAATSSAPTQPRGNDTGTARVPAGGADGALFGLNPGMRAERKARTATLPNGWEDANPGMTPAGKIARGNEITRTADGVEMRIRAKPDGTGYSWRVTDQDGDVTEGESRDMRFALDDTALQHYGATGNKLPQRDRARFSDVRPPRVEEALRGAGATPPPTRSDAQRRRAAVQAMTPVQREAHARGLDRRARMAKGGTRAGSGNPQEAARLRREASETRKINQADTRARNTAAAEQAEPVDQRPEAAGVTRRPRAADFEARDLTDQATRDAAERNRNAGIPSPDRTELNAANLRYDNAARTHATALQSSSLYSDEQRQTAERNALAAARGAEAARKKYLEQAAKAPAADSSHATARGGVAAARRRMAADGRPVYMVASGEGAGVRLTGTRPTRGPFAQLTRGTDWGVYEGPGQQVPSRTTTPGISQLRARVIPDRQVRTMREAQEEARRRYDADGRISFIVQDGDGARVSDTRPEDGRAPYATFSPSSGKWQSYLSGRDGVPPSLTTQPDVIRRVEAPARPQVDQTRQRAVANSREAYAKEEYGLTEGSFRGANTAGSVNAGDRAYEALLGGDPQQSLRLLQTAAQEMRSSGNTAGADRVARVASTVERKLRAPKNAGTTLTPINAGARSRSGVVTRKAVDHQGREWDLELNPDAGTVQATSGRLSASASYPRGDNAAAIRSANRLVGEMIGTLAEPERPRIRTGDVDSFNANRRAETEWNARESRFRRLRSMDDTGQSDDNRALAVMDARNAARNMRAVTHGVGMIPESQSTNALGRITARLMDDTGGEWSFEYDRNARVFWVDGPNGRTGSARVAPGLDPSMATISGLVDGLMAGRRRQIRDSDSIRQGG